LLALQQTAAVVAEEEEEKADTNNAVTRTLRDPSWLAS